MDTGTTNQDSTPSVNTPTEDKAKDGLLENSLIALHKKICLPCVYKRGFSEDGTTVHCAACDCTGIALEGGRCPVRHWGENKPGTKEAELGIPAGTWITGNFVVKNARHNPVIDNELNNNPKLERVGNCHWLIKK